MREIDLLDQRRRLSKLLVPAPTVPSLSVLPMATVAGDFALVETRHQKLVDVLADARDAADYVVIDTPPLGEVSDALRVAPHVDDIVVVARANNTERFALQELADLIERSGRRPKGYVLLEPPQRKRSAYYSYGLAERGPIAAPVEPPDEESGRPGQAPRSISR